MHEATTNRRTFLGGSFASLSSLAVSPAQAFRITGSNLFDGTSLSNNPLAAAFEILPPTIRPPDIAFETPGGAKRISELKSPATLISLWAEFCAPCLMEMPDLARLADRYRASGFNVIALHLGGTAQAAKAKLVAINASTIPSWNDAQGKFAKAVATPRGATGFTLPCNLLVDHNGRIRARAFGARSIESIGTPGRSLTAEEKRQLTRQRSAWSLAVADQFAQDLAGGLLSRL